MSEPNARPVDREVAKQLEEKSLLGSAYSFSNSADFDSFPVKDLMDSDDD